MIERKFFDYIDRPLCTIRGLGIGAVCGALASALFPGALCLVILISSLVLFLLALVAGAGEMATEKATEMLMDLPSVMWNGAVAFSKGLVPIFSGLGGWAGWKRRPVLDYILTTLNKLKVSPEVDLSFFGYTKKAGQQPRQAARFVVDESGAASDLHAEAMREAQRQYRKGTHQLANDLGDREDSLDAFKCQADRSDERD